MKYILKNTLSVLIMLVIAGSKSIAQENDLILSGKITDETGLPVSKVNIDIKELKKIIQTDIRGKYLIQNIKPGTYTLSISHIGRKKQLHSISIYQNEVADFVLANDAKRLSEIVVMGAQTMNHGLTNVGKASIKPLDLPQSVAVVGNETLKQQQSLRLSDVVKNVTGVSLGSTKGSMRQIFYLRGYPLSCDNLFKNGSRVMPCAMPEVSSLEKVEFMKGSTAALYGQVSPGGIINLVTKQPKFEPGLEVTIRTGSNDLYKPIFDTYGPINSKIAYRINGTYEHAKSFRQHVRSERYYINPSLLFKLGAKTELLVQGDYLQDEFTPDYGTGAIDNVIAEMPRSSFLGASWSNAHTQQATASALFNHRCDQGWQLHADISYQLYKRKYQSTEGIKPHTDGDWERFLGMENTNEHYYAGQINFTGKIKMGIFEHTLLLGSDVYSYLSTNYRYPSTIKYDKINIFNPNKYVPRVDVPMINPSSVMVTPTDRFGVYINDLIGISARVKVLAGIRWSYQHTSPVKTTDWATNIMRNDPARFTQAFSPRLGLVYQLGSNTSLFASYANSFSINNAKDIYGNLLKPSLIDQYELGTKNDFFKGLLSANLTIYHIVNNDLAQTAQFAQDGVTLNTNPNFKELVGQTKSEGLELDLSSRPMTGLTLLAGYSYSFMRFTKTPNTKGSYIVGDRLPNMPTHTASASIFYEFSTKKLRGFQLGASANYVGERIAGRNRTIGGGPTQLPFSVSDFTTIDLSAGYSYKRFSLLGKISNVGNTLNYYVHENYSVNPIAPRQFLTTLSYKLQ